MPAFASKGHLIRSFNKLGDLLLTFGKQNKKPHAQHNPWQEQRHNKPAGTYSLADAQTESAKLFNITNPAKQKITCPIINVPCFNVVKTKSAKKNAKRLIEENYPEGSANLTPKSYLQQELDRQLADQEAALNEMSVAEYLEGRELFTNNKRGNKSTQGARNRFREDLIDDGQEKFQNDPNLSKAEIEAKATERADRIIKHLAALHNPDQVVGGKDKIDADSFGLTNVNSSIGTQWIKGGKEQPTQLSRVATIDEGAQTVAENQRHKTKMNVRLTRCSDDNTCNI